MNTVKQILKIKGDQVWTISGDSSVYEALELMTDKKIGSLLVMQDNKVVGIFYRKR